MVVDCKIVKRIVILHKHIEGIPMAGSCYNVQPEFLNDQMHNLNFAYHIALFSLPFKVDTADTQVERTFQRKYLWSIDDLKEFKSIMIDFQSTQFRQNVLNTLVELEDTNRVASAFNKYVTEAVERVSKISKPTGRVKNKGAPWFDKECRQKRAVAIQAGHWVESIVDRQTQIEACRHYRTHKQRKRREYFSNCIRSIADIYQSDRSKVWQTLKKLSGPNCDISAHQTMSFSTISKTSRIFIQKVV